LKKWKQGFGLTEMTHDKKPFVLRGQFRDIGYYGKGESCPYLDDQKKCFFGRFFLIFLKNML